MAGRAKVSALLPAYQASEFIQPTLDSLSAQTCNDFNVLVSVDCCADDTDEVCLRHSGKDPRFQVFRQDKRLGYVGNCNFLLNQAAADYVLLAFHDDILAPTYVEKICRVLDARPEVVMGYSDGMLTFVDGTQKPLAFSGLEGLRSPLERGRKMLKCPEYWWVPNRGLFRLTEARKIQGLKTHGAGEFSADRPWLLHMSLLGEFARVPEMLFEKHYKPGSLSRNWDFSQRQHYEVSLACLREIRISGLSPWDKLRLALPLAIKLSKTRFKFFRRGVKKALSLSR